MKVSRRPLSLNSCFVSLLEQTLVGWRGGRTLPDQWRGVLRRDGFHVPSSCNSAHVDRPPRERGFSGATGSPFHITPPAASPAWGLPKTPPREERGADPAAGGPIGRFPPLPTAPTPPCIPGPGNKARDRATLALRPGPGTREPAPPLPRAPPSLFGWPGARRMSSVTPPAAEPLGPASGLGVPVRRPRGSPRSPRHGRSPSAGRGARVPTAAPRPHAPAPASRSPARRHRQQQLRTPAPRPGGPRWRPQPRPPGLPCRPGTRRLGRARGRFWGRECKQIGVL